MSDVTQRDQSDYDTDFYGWTIAQAALLRDRNAAAIDWERLADEIESMGRQERRELVSRLRLLLGHLLKWRYQPDRQSRSWMTTIRVQRLEIRKLLAKNPSLKSAIPEAFAEAYELGRLLAIDEMGLEDYEENLVPSESPFDWEFVLNSDQFDAPDLI